MAEMLSKKVHTDRKRTIPTTSWHCRQVTKPARPTDDHPAGSLRVLTVLSQTTERYPTNEGYQFGMQRHGFLTRCPAAD